MKMLICSIGSRRHMNTLRFGAAVAKALAADTTLLGVVPRLRQVEEMSQALDKVARDLADQELPVHVRVEAGRAEDIVLACMEESPYDLVAIGALGGKRSRRALLNSVGMRIVERADSSVLLIKGDRPSLSRVLIAASGAEQGHPSVWAGALLACGAGSRATVLHVVDSMPSMYAGLEQMEETLAELLESHSDVARELKWAAGVVGKECKISELKVRRGMVADEVLHEGQEGDYDLIVLGSSRSASGLVRVLMGDLTREIVSRAQRPVLVVRPSDGNEISA